MVQKKPSIFISYAHRDGLEFVRRLAFALGLYADVFWDMRLQGGEFPPQLFAEIEKRDFFIFVVSPCSLASEWCQHEREYAEQTARTIVLTRTQGTDPTDWPDLAQKYTYCDYTEEFNQGFRRTCEMVLGRPYSSWEWLPDLSDAQLLRALNEGVIPGLIAKEIAEWAIVEKLWAHFESYISQFEARNPRLFRATPRTPAGIMRQYSILEEQFTENRDVIGVDFAERTRPILELFFKKIMPRKDDDHERLGRSATSVIRLIKNNLELDAVGFRDAVALMLIQDGYFDFEVAEKLRELINIHARRSRYLY